MPNLRIIHNNVADSATSLAASTTAAGGNVDASNMQTDRKSEPHRSTGTSVSYTLTWTAGESIGGIALPATNLSAEATIRARLYSDTAGLTLLADTGTIDACPGLEVDLWDWEGVLDANAFTYGGLSKSAVWFDAHWFAKRCVIDLVDPTNPAGYIDCSRLVIGPTWSPAKNAKFGVQVSRADRSPSHRNEADDLIVDRLQQHDVMVLDLPLMAETDRARLDQIIKNVGTSRNFFLSLLPDNASPVAEQDGMIYGHRANAPMSFDMVDAFSNRIDLEGW